MERYHLAEDILVFCVQASSFPAGIRRAFLQLRSQVDDLMLRDFFGIIYRDSSGHIIYKAAVSALPGEKGKQGCELFVLPSGEYLTEWLNNWPENEKEINHKFSRLSADPRTDHLFPYVEWYEDRKTMLCMVKMLPSEQDHFFIDNNTGLIRH